MRAGDRLLQRWRVARALPFVREGDRLLDIGCYDRTLLDRVAARTPASVGIDPVAEPSDDGHTRVLHGRFPDDAPFEPGSFDCVTMLAVFEHVSEPEAFVRKLHELLAPGGRVVLTVPHALVDRILDVLIALRVVDGMDLEEHHGFDVAETGPLFEAAGFRQVAHQRFQLGLNRLYVFEKPAGPT